MKTQFIAITLAAFTVAACSKEKDTGSVPSKEAATGGQEAPPQAEGIPIQPPAKEPEEEKKDTRVLTNLPLTIAGEFSISGTSSVSAGAIDPFKSRFDPPIPLRGKVTSLKLNNIELKLQSPELDGGILKTEDYGDIEIRVRETDSDGKLSIEFRAFPSTIEKLKGAKQPGNPAEEPALQPGNPAEEPALQPGNPAEEPALQPGNPAEEPALQPDTSDTTTEVTAWEKAKEENSVKSYKQFLVSYPRNNHANDCRSALVAIYSKYAQKIKNEPFTTEMKMIPKAGQSIAMNRHGTMDSLSPGIQFEYRAEPKSISGSYVIRMVLTYQFKIDKRTYYSTDNKDLWLMQNSDHLDSCFVFTDYPDLPGSVGDAALIFSDFITMKTEIETLAKSAATGDIKAFENLEITLHPETEKALLKLAASKDAGVAPRANKSLTSYHELCLKLRQK